MIKGLYKSKKQSSDNTRIKKPVIKEIGPTYKYMGKSEYLKEKPTQKDSSDYRRGYTSGIKDVSTRKGYRISNEEYKKGLTVVGLNPRYNEGFSEGKDKALKDKLKKK